jgi:hypothetical protein
MPLRGKNMKGSQEKGENMKENEEREKIKGKLKLKR